jgi:uncharacterized DUF497 family protein
MSSLRKRLKRRILVTTKSLVKITFDPAKREATLATRKLDFLDAPEVLNGPTVRWIDDRFDYEEERRVAVGRLAERMIFVVYTERPAGPHIISMRKANSRERARFEPYLD